MLNQRVFLKKKFLGNKNCADVECGLNMYFILKLSEKIIIFKSHDT